MVEFELTPLSIPVSFGRQRLSMMRAARGQRPGCPEAAGPLSCNSFRPHVRNRRHR